MNEQNVDVAFSVMRELLGSTPRTPTGHDAQAEQLATAALTVGVQVVTDLHRIADALEQIALNTQPRPGD